MNFEIRIGSIILKTDGDTMWLETVEGEAMEVSPDEIEKILSDYYAGNF